MIGSRYFLRCAIYIGLCVIICGLRIDAEPQELLFYLPDSPPQGIEPGEKRGIMSEVAIEAARRAGYRARTEMLPWPRVLMNVKNGRNLFIAGLSRFPAREGNYTWIFPVFTLWRSFVTTGPRINSYAEGRSLLKKVAAHYGSLEITMLKAEGFSDDQLSLITTNTPEIEFLMIGRVDALYRPIAEVKWFARSRADSNRLVYGAPMQPTEQYIAGSLDCSPEVVERLRRALKGMRDDGTIKKIVKGYE